VVDIRKRVVGLVVLLLTASPTVVLSQRTAPAAVTGASAFAAEAVGGAAGSALGVVVGLAIADPDDCAVEDDVVCPLKRLSVAGLMGVLGATMGTVVAGRAARTNPSLIGAFLGAVVGAAAGIGLDHLVTEEMGQSLGDVGAIALFSLTQGVLAAAGSRIGSRLAARR
jgi:hypothetical protein